jgi:Protein of unknown function (DUF1524)
LRTVGLGCVLLILLGGCVVPAAPPAGATPSEVSAQLDQLTVAAPRSMTGYSRDRFPTWLQLSGGCNVRDAVLKRDGTGVRTDASCRIIAGSWFSPYDEKTVTDADQVDIDHVVPLAEAWRSGASAWTDDRRSEFANDLVRPELLTVSRTINRAKGDQDPSRWRPPNQGYWCSYAGRWIAVKHHWALTATEGEKTALREMLGRCPAPSGSSQTSSPAPAGS